ncbi:MULTISPECIES: hypothetical protein [Sutcliffiella]|uniref:Thiopeptide-type bacteriocin biosynthesis domain-containing protein n=1 Tax=Sutcliffiella cohnii TaxID=33932 RepID=A0A223KNK6_9BACI|nr:MULTISPECIES: hypothetical protein [Sutcliffiella]AST91029.1 hypothetical protein BC6307_06920 [Sutcliffiella cohnii]WBL16827.1 hypothetical protein O1A01_09400 [Sutcliffiella sp. NC1]
MNFDHPNGQRINFTIFYNSNSSNLYTDCFQPISKKLEQEGFPKYYLKRNWIGGPNYTLKVMDEEGTFPISLMKEVEEMFLQFVSHNPSPPLDELLYRKKIEKIAHFENRKVKDLIRNNTVLTEVDKEMIEKETFENLQQLKSYEDLCCQMTQHVLSIQAKCLTRKEMDKEVFCMLIVLACHFPKWRSANNPNLQLHGFVSYYSHYVGFLHSLSMENKDKVETSFRMKFEASEEEYRSYTKEIIDRLKGKKEDVLQKWVEYLQYNWPKVQALYQDGAITYNSPYSTKEYDIEQYSEGHKNLMSNPTNLKELAEHEHFSTYRWILNVFYAHFPLLNTAALTKFYNTYALSTLYLKDNQLFDPLFHQFSKGVAKTDENVLSTVEK